jgi:hypothetical protein
MDGLAAFASVPIGAMQEVKYVLWFVDSTQLILQKIHSIAWAITVNIIRINILHYTHLLRVYPWVYQSNCQVKLVLVILYLCMP